MDGGHLPRLLVETESGFRQCRLTWLDRMEHDGATFRGHTGYVHVTETIRYAAVGRRLDEYRDLDV